MKRHDMLPIGTLVYMLRNKSNILVITGYSDANAMYYVRGALDETARTTAEFAAHITPATLIDLCNARAKLDGLIQDFVKKSSE